MLHFLETICLFSPCSSPAFLRQGQQQGSIAGVLACPAVCTFPGEAKEGRDRQAVRQKEEIPLPGVRAHFPAIKADWG